MSVERRQLVREVFTAALDVDPAGRAAFVRERVGGDAELAEEVLSLLASLDGAQGYLVSPTSPLGEGVQEYREGTAASLVGTRVGPYKLLEMIGEGGFGVVYVAEQEKPLRRRVALKLIKAGMDSAQVIARFEAERQALAMMDHPNIARVLDAGTTELGRPYFVMELVRGVPITKYCDEARLNTRERLELLVPVCQAVQHAHSKGVIHRDIKPGNVLVTLHDGEPVPKVIDFGIAKAVSGRLSDATVYTELRQMVGTPAYMSPEQAEMSGLDVDTRSDVYSLGVLMYELLTGTPPLDSTQMVKAGLAEMQRMIRETEPPRPSTRVSTSGDRLVDIAGRRRTEPSRLSKLMRGELDCIVMRAMEKDRRRRYGTADALAADIRRHLAGEVVEARPPGGLYRLSKLVRRNKGPFAAAVAVGLALVAGLVVAWVGFAGMVRERDRAVGAEEAQRNLRIAADASAKAESEARAKSDKETARAESMLAFSDLMIGSADPNVMNSPQSTTRQMLDRASARVEEFFKGQPEAEFAMRVRMGRAYWSMRAQKETLEQFKRADELLKAHAEWTDPDLRDFYVDYHFARRGAFFHLRDSVFHAAIVRSVEIVKGADAESGALLEKALTAHVLQGRVNSGTLAELEALVAYVRAHVDARSPGWTATARALLIWGAWMDYLQWQMADRSLPAKVGDACYATSLAMLLEVLPETHSDVALVRQWHAESLARANRYDAALEVVLRWKEAATPALPKGHWLLHLIDAYQAEGLLKLGRNAEGVAVGEPAVTALMEITGRDIETANIGNSVAKGFHELGDEASADRWWRRVAEFCLGRRAGAPSREVMQRMFLPEQTELADAVFEFYRLRDEKDAAAGPALERVLTLWEQGVLKPDDRGAPAMLLAARTVEMPYQNGQKSRGVTEKMLVRFMRQHVAFSRRVPGTVLAEEAWPRLWLAKRLVWPEAPAQPTGAELQEGESLLREVVDAWNGEEDSYSNLADTKNMLGSAMVKQRRCDEALVVLEPLYAECLRTEGPAAHNTLAALSAIAYAHELSGRGTAGVERVRRHLALPGADGGIAPFYFFFVEALRRPACTRDDTELLARVCRVSLETYPTSMRLHAALACTLKELGDPDAGAAEAKAVEMMSRTSVSAARTREMAESVLFLPGAPAALVDAAVTQVKRLAGAGDSDPRTAQLMLAGDYRTGRLAEVVAACAELRADEPLGEGEVAILAMAQFRLGDVSGAKATLSARPKPFIGVPLSNDQWLMKEAWQLVSGVGGGEP